MNVSRETLMFSSEQIKNFKKFCSSFQTNISDEHIQKFWTYTNLLLDWNKRIHLVSKKDASTDRIIRHFVDSLSIFKAIELPDNINILDIGSGAGFPSIPIKIVRDDVNLTLVESIHKKALFLLKLCEVLRLRNTFILNQRAENLLEEGNLENNFDIVTAKALGSIDNTAHLGTSFLKARGLLVAYKGKDVQKEIEKINSSNEYQIKDMVKIEIPEISLLRWLIVIQKPA